MVLLGPREVPVLLWRCGGSKMKGLSLFPSRQPPLYTRKKTYIVPCKKERKKKKKEKQKGKPRYPDSHVVPIMVPTERSSA